MIKKDLKQQNDVSQIPTNFIIESFIDSENFIQRFNKAEELNNEFANNNNKKWTNMNFIL